MASDLDLQCVSLSHKKDARLKWAKLTATALYAVLGKKIFLFLYIYIFIFL